jgi:hypothetical protein
MNSTLAKEIVLSLYKFKYLSELYLEFILSTKGNNLFEAFSKYLKSDSVKTLRILEIPFINCDDFCFEEFSKTFEKHL